MEFQVEDDPDSRDIEFLETQIRREASAAMQLGDEVELAIFVRHSGKIVAGISGWTWGDCCELQSLWVEPSLRGRWLGTRLIAAAEAEAAARGCSQSVHFTYAFQAGRLYERNGYELVGKVEDFPSGTNALWYRKRLNSSAPPPGQRPHPSRPPQVCPRAPRSRPQACAASTKAVAIARLAACGCLESGFSAPTRDRLGGLIHEYHRAAA